MSYLLRFSCYECVVWVLILSLTAYVAGINCVKYYMCKLLFLYRARGECNLCSSILVRVDFGLVYLIWHSSEYISSDVLFHCKDKKEKLIFTLIRKRQWWWVCV